MVGFNTGIWSKLGFIKLWFGAAATFWLVSVHRITAGCVFCFSLSVLLIPSWRYHYRCFLSLGLKEMWLAFACIKLATTKLGGWCGWLLGCYCVVAKVFRMLFRSIQFLECCGWLLMCSKCVCFFFLQYTVYRMLWVGSRVLLCGY